MVCSSVSSAAISRLLRKRGVTGEILLQLLETRLDNVVHKLGFAKTCGRPADRCSRSRDRQRAQDEYLVNESQDRG